MPGGHLLAEPLSGGGRYYIGYYSALQIHGLITQPSLKEQVVREKRLGYLLDKLGIGTEIVEELRALRTAEIQKKANKERVRDTQIVRFEDFAYK